MESKLSCKKYPIAEQSHSNDVALATIQEEYATVNEVNEVNEVLANNYVLKSELPDSNHWNLYYSTFTIFDQDSIENLIDLQYDSNTKKLSYYIETTFNGLLIFNDANKKHFLRTDFKKKICYLDEIYNCNKTANDNENEDKYIFDIDAEINGEIKNLEFYIDITSKLDNQTNNLTNILDNNYYTKAGCNNRFATKEEVNELKKENAILKATIASFETRLSALENK